MPRIVIIVPSYNHARYLSACLESVQAQTFRDWSLLLIDDGSRDESVEIAREFARRDHRIQVQVNEMNRGTYSTQQRGLDETDSPLVAILNSDDLWAPSKLERQVDLLDRYPSAPYSYVLGALIDDQGRLQGEDVHKDWPRDEVQDPLPYLLYENRILASGVLFRRAGLRFVTTCRYSGDWIALLERSVVGPAACVDERLTFWRQHGENTYIASPRQMAEEIRVREAIERRSDDWSLPRLDPSAVRRGLGKNSLNLLALHAFFRDHSEARAAGLKAIAYGSRASVKRTLATYLGQERLRRHLWPAMAGAANDLTPEDLRLVLAESPTLELQIQTA